ncbi:hypothetical protein D3C72_940570 [compost metagenome]
MTGHQARLHVAVQGADHRRRDHPFRSATDAIEHVHFAVRQTGEDGGSHVAVGNGEHPHAQPLHLLDRLVMTRLGQGDDGQAGERLAERLGHGLEVQLQGLIEIDGALGTRTHDQLLHVHVGSLEEGALVAHGQHGQGIGLPHGGHAGALYGVDRDVHGVALTRAHLLADVEHGGFVDLAFAYHNLAIDLDLIEDVTHGRNGRAIGDILVTTSEPLVASQCSRFRHSGKFDCQFTSHRISNLRSSKTGGILPQGQTFARKSGGSPHKSRFSSR